MIRLFRFLITGDWHLHKWDKGEDINVWGDSTKYPAYRKTVCRCKECGKIKVVKI